MAKETIEQNYEATSDDEGCCVSVREISQETRAMMMNASFESLKGVMVLKIEGSPYQMGFQHGYLLVDRIETMATKTLLALPAYIATLAGISFEESMERALEGQRAAESCLPHECREEMQGIVDGAQSAGFANITLEKILLWNTYYDQWCLYSHPHNWESDEKEKRKQSGFNAIFSSGSAGGCSSFTAWNKAAGGDGKLIFGKNEDNFGMPYQGENRVMIVAKPSHGHGHVFMAYPGLIGLDGGLNEAGFEMMTQLNSMVDETMAGCGIAVFTRLLLAHASTVEDAIQIFQNHQRCGGIGYHVADAKAKQAAVIETSSTRICIRYPKTGAEMLWQSNHSNCYPGWEGYQGYNMVKDQQLVHELEDTTTIGAWQRSLRDPDNYWVQAPSRFERYRTLLQDEYYGNITPENAIAILSDRVDPYSENNRERGKHEASVSNNILCTICALYPDMTFEAPEPLGNFQARISNMWSMVAYPATGDFWLAIQGFPAQYGGYEYFNLHQLLADKHDSKRPASVLQSRI